MSRTGPIARLAAVVSASSRGAVAALVAGNLLVALGVLLWDWNVFTLLLAYWLENGVVGLVHLIRLAAAPEPRPDAIRRRLFLVLFFALHFGLFTLVHGILLFRLFGDPGAGEVSGPAGLLAAVARRIAADGLAWPLAAMLLSHGISLWYNGFGRHELRRIDPGRAMALPYRRVVGMQAVVLLGALLSRALGASGAGLLALVAVKTIADLTAHLAERRRLA